MGVMDDSFHRHTVLSLPADDLLPGQMKFLIQVITVTGDLFHLALMQAKDIPGIGGILEDEIVLFELRVVMPLYNGKFSCGELGKLF